MAEQDDIAASLPQPPPPSPARREQAIQMAMRRFDGEEPAEPARPRTTAPLWARLTRPQVGAFITLLIVAAIGIPLALDSWNQWPGAPPPARVSDNQPAPQPAGREPARSVTVPASKQPSPAAPTNVAATDKIATASVAAPKPAAPAPAEIALPPPPPPAAAPPPPPPPPPPSGESESNIVVAGRARQETLQNVPMSVSPVMEEQHRKASERGAGLAADSIAVTARRRTDAVGRGDWNACTVNDPDQSLDKCKRLSRSAARPDRDRAGAGIADGISRAWRGDVDGAIAAFDRSIALAPRNASAHLNRGMAYQRKGDLDRAIADFDQAVRIDPGAARGYYIRSLALRAKGNEKRARSDEQRAIEIDPNYAEAAR